MTTPKNGDGKSARTARKAFTDAALIKMRRFALSKNHTPDIGLLSTVATPACALRALLAAVADLKTGQKPSAAPWLKNGAERNPITPPRVTRELQEVRP